MSNTFGRIFSVTTFGESHGPAIGCVIDGCPPGISIDEDDFIHDLDRRKTGKSRHTSQRHEGDRVEILSGVFEGVTTGAPIALLIRNEDARSKDYTDIADKIRPGHADYTYLHKYGVRDYRGGGRASARETTMRVAAGVIAKKWLAQHHGIRIQGYVSQIGSLKPTSLDWVAVERNDFFWPNESQHDEIAALIDATRKAGDSIGGSVTVVASGVPVGLGQPIYHKLDAQLASAMMGINAAKAVEIGDGFDAVEQGGDFHRDLIANDGFESNHAGGILGGISTGQDIVCRVGFKPASSLRIPAKSVNTSNEEVEVVTKGRHDPCVALRAPVICEAMMALVLMDMALLHRAQCGE